MTQVIVEANLSTITALTVDGRGSLWAGTPGGLIEWPKTAASSPKRYGRESGVPGLRVLRLGLDKGNLIVEAEGRAKFSGGKYVPTSQKLAQAKWSPDEVQLLPGPPIAKAYWEGASLYAVPESGLLKVAGGKAAPFKPQPPTLQVSSLAVYDGCLCVGTGSQGVWKLSAGKWSRLEEPRGALRGSDAVSLIPLLSQVAISPREGTSFFSSGARAQASGAPWRQSVTWRGQTVVRRADGLLVTVDEQGTERPFSHKLPRVSATSIAVCGETLFVAQPGGWSEFSQEGAAHHFDLSQLQGCPTTAIWADAERVWIGTQNAGLIEFERSKGEAKSYHEAHGLTDDWVTALAQDEEGRLLVGTYVGGLHTLDRGQMKQVGLKGGFVTRLLPDRDRVWVGSLTGMRRWAEGSLRVPLWNGQIEPDVTDIAKNAEELWIASGGALHRVKNP